MDPVLFSIGGFEVRYYGLMYALALLVGIELAKIHGKKKGLDTVLIENYAMVAMISGLLGGRLYYVMFNLPYYLSNLLEIPAVWHGGMAIHGGILGGIVGTFIFGARHKISPWKLGDIAAAPFILGQALGRIGNFTNGEVHGVPTYTPWSVIFTLKPQFYSWYGQYQALTTQAKMKYQELVPWGLVFPDASPAGTEFPNQALHPAMLYELGLNFTAFLFLWFYMKRRDFAEGVTWWTYVILYSLIRTFVSFFRSEDLMFFGFRAPHVISIVLIAVSILMIVILTKREKLKEKN